MIKDKGTTLKAYLIAYNVFQFLGWLIILIQTTSHVLTNGEIKGLWEATNICLKIFQTLAFLEVFHVLLGLVRSGIMTTLIQVSSRLIVLWLICYNFKAPQNSYGLLMILIAWSITEITRYSFYFLNLLKQVPSFIIYLRYTLFIVLYPLGVTGEQWCLFVALSEISKTNALSIRMPNVFNFTFDLFYFCIVLMLLYIPFFPQLYLHMFAQRKKMIGDKQK